MGVLCQAQHAGSEEDDGGGREGEDGEGRGGRGRYSTVEAHQIKSNSVGPGNLGNGSGKEEHTGTNFAMTPSSVLNPLPLLPSMCRATPGLLAS
jgi:hypothetical protein